MSQEQIQKLQQDLIVLKARIFDAEEAKRSAEEALQQLANLSAKAVGFEGVSFDELIKTLQDIADGQPE